MLEILKKTEGIVSNRMTGAGFFKETETRS